MPMFDMYVHVGLPKPKSTLALFLTLTIQLVQNSHFPGKEVLFAFPEISKSFDISNFDNTSVFVYLNTAFFMHHGSSFILLVLRSFTTLYYLPKKICKPSFVSSARFVVYFMNYGIPNEHEHIME